MDIEQEQTFTRQNAVRLEKLFLNGEDMEFEEAWLVEEEQWNELYGLQGMSHHVTLKKSEGAIELNHSLMDMEIVTNVGTKHKATGMFEWIERDDDGKRIISDAKIVINGKLYTNEGHP